MANVVGQLETSQNPYGKLLEGGLVSFLNNLVTLIITLAGIFTLINFIIAGYQYMSASGDPQRLAAAGNKILQSIIGLVVIAAAFIIAGLVGFVLYGDAASLLSPTLFKLK
ncbi:MAG: hypothetical protein UX85_C0008G0021 [Candidatus Beckwithbacteria bacterium GW2011_GWB1_47_15]|uniref:Integral membrane protein n=1 Tax=Candidatus Beckwithbacteria bacterium GW2011_GWB1_47_15 TaxID=1618371 RepID=A0A0G1RU52_9BACT|nr:MAG: hypothetical protein UX85_C0008G0021 [Candidatus Beckwithbacteria bacterium GW2011_GWB1_47_15]KKW02882.1 MAG: hypothetical protein UY37_C0010G0020 [Candidatus Beckwithbacteria bacterium GW2011_GWC2_49_11]OGD65784.1 MAG: hypothetical protein A2584_03825 [Candidatus Beckwithbacteria bacterium RIFOXYD1_FULL_50_11]HAF64112.1 hypothetical protein [Candidatus Beckwithbacteria bacterium]HCQ92607.1 hypothetical protein [Candidatus Beckwithbacteria bacterium]